MANFIFTFDSRETYLEYRADWKSRYAEISQNIRDARTAFKEAQRSGSYSRICSALSMLTSLRTKATETLVELSEAKVEASHQYQAKKVV